MYNYWHFFSDLPQSVNVYLLVLLVDCHRVVKACNEGAKKMLQTEQMCLLASHLEFTKVKVSVKRVKVVQV
jgi:sensor histidine kinase regulating citrate/malate metabolism